MVRSASSDSMPLVGHLIPVILQQLAAALDPAQTTGQNSPSDLQVQHLLHFRSSPSLTVGSVHRLSPSVDRMYDGL